MHAGTVTARSDGPGQGTEITIRVPVVAVQPVISNPPREAAFATAVEPRRVLVADDNRDAAESLSLQLQLAGHDVRTAHDGAEALTMANAFGPDVVFLDLGIPKMDGCETAKQIRLQRWGRSTTLVALTGWGQQRDRQRTADAGFDIHLVKPVAMSDLGRVLTSSVERSRRVSTAGN
jgi:CheY-like chemotaxis protein